MINDQLYKYLNIFIVAYLDNILVFSKDKKEYIIYVQRVLKKLKHIGLLFKPEKCEFYKEELAFLGFIIGKNRTNKPEFGTVSILLY